MSKESHIVVQRNVYHQRPGQQPVGLDGKGYHSYVRVLESDDPPHVVDPFVVGAAWTPIPLGYCESVGLVVITNREGLHVSIPTEDQKQQMAQRVIEVALGSDGRLEADLEVKPGESQDLSPLRSLIHVRSRNGMKLTASLMIIPK